MDQQAVSLLVDFAILQFADEAAQRRLEREGMLRIVGRRQLDRKPGSQRGIQQQIDAVVRNANSAGG